MWVSFHIAIVGTCGIIAGFKDDRKSVRLLAARTLQSIFDAICAACGCLCLNNLISRLCGLQPLRFLKPKQHVMLNRGWAQLQNSEKRTRMLAGTGGSIADNLNKR